MKTQKTINQTDNSKPQSLFVTSLKRLKKNKLAMIGLIVIILLIIIAVFGPMIYPQSWQTVNKKLIYAKPSPQHILGTDNVGRDMLARVIYGSRISLLVGIISVSIQIVIGGTLGIIAGYYGKMVDTIIMRIVDIIMCFPFLPIAIMLAAIMSDLKVPPSYRMYYIMIIIGVLSWPGLCRIVRGQVLSLKEQEFMQATEALGLKDRRKLFVHLLPNTMPSIIVSATLNVGYAILTESALSFLGLGVTPPTPTWGNIIQFANDLYNVQYRPWLWLPPGIAIFITVMAINLFGDGLRDALDPKLKT